METLERYRAIVQELLEKQAAIKYSQGDFRRELVIDHDHDRYLLLAMGWDKKKRVHDVVMHIDICDGKIWIQENRTDLDIAKELMQAGVSADHIVLGLLPPTARQYSDFAIA